MNNKLRKDIENSLCICKITFYHEGNNAINSNDDKDKDYIKYQLTSYVNTIDRFCSTFFIFI